MAEYNAVQSDHDEDDFHRDEKGHLLDDEALSEDGQTGDTVNIGTNLELNDDDGNPDTTKEDKQNEEGCDDREQDEQSSKMRSLCGNHAAENDDSDGKTMKSMNPVEVQDILHKALICRLPASDLVIINRAGADINGTIRRGLRPAHYAAFDNNVEGLQFLLSHDCQLNVHDVAGHTPVHICAKRGNYDCLKLLLEHGAYASFMGDFGDDDERAGWSEIAPDPLNLALQFGHVECARLLLEHGAQANNRYVLGSEINLLPLQNMECLRLLLDHGADPNVLSRNGHSPLMTACKEQNYDAAQLLIEYGANVNQKSSKRFEEKTALYFCILSGNCEVLALLLENSVDLYSTVSANNNALTFAVSRDRYLMCQLLIAHGSDVNERNADGLTPLLSVCSTTGLTYHVEILQLLLENGADPNSHHHTMRYFTPSLAPIHEYFIFNRGDNFNGEVVKLLVRYGARVTFGLSHSQKHIKEPYSVLNHVRKLDSHQDILALLVDVAESFDCKLISQCDLIPEVKRNELLDVGASPLGLKHLVRLSLRRNLGPVLPQKVQLLPLPNILKSYLTFYL